MPAQDIIVFFLSADGWDIVTYEGRCSQSSQSIMKVYIDILCSSSAPTGGDLASVDTSRTVPGRLLRRVNKVSLPHSFQILSRIGGKRRSSNPLYQCKAGGKARRARATV